MIPRMLSLSLAVAIAVTSTSCMSPVRARRVPAQAPTLPLLQQGDVTGNYLGAFRLPFLDYQVYGTNFSGGAFGMGFVPTHQSLIVSVDEGNNNVNSWLAEVSIPTPKLAPCVRTITTGTWNLCGGLDLNESSLLQAPREAFGGLLGLCNQGSQSGCRVRGILATTAGDLILSGFINYDGTYVGAKSQYRRPLNLATGPVIGPLEVNAFGAGSAMNGGVCGGFQARVPTAWQASLGGDTICSNWNTSINSRMSWGPSAVVYNSADVGTTNPVPATPLLYYNADHPMLGTPMAPNMLWNDAGLAGGAVFVDGTSTILFIGEHTDGPCYGVATQNPAQAGQVVQGGGDIYCLDYEVMGKGQHGNPWTQRVMAYDAHDLLAVKQGLKQPWDLKPYAYWDFSFPQFQMSHYIKSSAYDAVTQRLYLASQYGDSNNQYYNAPIIHVYQLNAPGAPPPPPGCSVTIAQSALPNGTSGASYSQSLTANGGTSPYAFTVTSGSLPAGLTLSSAGVASGTPTTSGAFTFTVRATDAKSCVKDVSYTVTIAAAPPPPPPVCPAITIAPVSLPNGIVGAVYSQSLTASGGASPYTFALASGGVPTGMTLSPSGAVTGTPTTTESSVFTVRAKDANACSKDAAFTITVAPKPDQCVTNPLVVTGIKFPTGDTGAKSGSWNSSNFVLVQRAFKSDPMRFEATDTRGCPFTQLK